MLSVTDFGIVWMCWYFSFDFSDVEQGQPVVYRSVFTIPTYTFTCVIGIYDTLLYIHGAVVVH